MTETEEKNKEKVVILTTIESMNVESRFSNLGFYEMQLTIGRRELQLFIKELYEKYKLEGNYSVSPDMKKLVKIEPKIDDQLG
jgi:3-deoxy-D-manno-octulosonate 8-phosphate phosphatase KdsC-like HAD superfamily phosphatase